MATSLGSLVVSLGLDAAQFTTGLTKAQRDVQQFSNTVKGLFATLGVGISFAGLTELSRRTILAAEHMQNLATDTGSTVEEISRLSNIARISGTSFETFESALLRLAAGLNGSEELSTKTADALKFLGITSKDPAAAMQELATALNKFADGAGKAAIARDLFGRGGAAFLSTLKSIAENQDQVNTRTTEQAEKATKLAESMRSLSVNSTAVGNAILNDIVPPLNALVGALTDAINKSDGLGQALKNVALLNPFQSFGQNINELNKEIAHEQDIINKGGASIWTSLLGEDHGKSEVDLAIREIARLTAARDIAKAGQARAALAIGSVAGNMDARDIRFAQKPTLNFVSGKGAGAGAADDPTRKLLEATLSAIKAITEQEKAVLQNREQFLQAIFDRGESSISDYYANKQAAQNEDLKITTENYRQELTAIDNFIKNSATARDRAEGQKQRVDATNRQQLAVIQAAGKAQAAIDDQRRATADYTAQVEELNAKMLELAGNTRAAAEIRFDAQNSLLLSRAQKAGDTQTVANLATLREQLGIVNALSRAQQEYSNSLEKVGIATARIDLLRSTGALTEIEALTKRSDLTRANIGLLNQEIDAYQKLAEGLQGVDREKALINVQRMRLEVDALAASSDLLAKKFNDAFADAFADTIFKLTTGVESLTDAVKDFEKQLLGAVSRIAAQNIAESIFKPLSAGGTAGSGFDIGAIFAKLFSASSGGSPPVDLGQFFASGGMPPVGMASVVGERGPELFVPKVAGTIIPNSVLTSRRAGRSNVTVHVNVLPGATRASADQAASAVGAEIRRAMARTT